MPSRKSLPPVAAFPNPPALPGMKVMCEDGVLKALRGIPTLEEVFRVSKRVET